MENIDFAGKVRHILEYDGRYPAEAYDFVNAAVKYTIETLEKSGRSGYRHIKARELIDGMIDFACQEYGPLAWEVFSSWNTVQPRDVGNIVFNLVNEKLFSTSDDDSPSDFDLVYDIRAKLEAPFRQNHSDSRYDIPIIA